VGGPLRILHVVVNMNRGGAETLLMNLYRNIDRSKVQFDFLTCKEGVFDKEILELGGKIHRISYITDVGHKGYLKALDKFFESHLSYKVVHSHMDKMSGLVLRSAKKADIPVRIAHSHSTQSEGGILAKAYKQYVGSNIIPYATHLYACSYGAAKWLFGKSHNKATILNNGIEYNKFRFSNDIRKKMRDELNVGKNTLVIGHVGRFNKPKNHTFIIDIYHEIVKLIPDSVLVLVGNGQLHAEIREKAVNLNLLENIKFLGLRGDVDHMLQGFDQFVFPSLHEGLPVTLIEAQGAGLQCIISEAITKEVDMGLGLVHYLPLTEKRMWVDKVNNLASESKDRNISISKLAQKGYDIRKTAEITQNAYLSLGDDQI
jgi:glycosyltransferase involved in cell wall biosynthesis